MAFKFDVEALREQFPACDLQINGTPIAYLDGPGGTQVPYSVLDAITGYMIYDNANEDGNFRAGLKQGDIEIAARQAGADFLGCDVDEVGYNCSSTQNNYNLAANISKEFKEGDEIIVTQIDHQCNIQPWRSLARYGCVIKEVRLDPETQQLDFDDYMSKLSDKTKLVAVNWAANGIGTITDVKKFIDEAHKVGAFTVVDAVHYAAHLPIDVKAIDTDCLVCSPYKWFGPHMGLIYLKKEHLDRLEINNAGAPDIAEGARQFHMGTPQYEHLRGCEAAVNFIASIGEKYIEYFEEETKGLEGRRKYVVAGMLAIDAYEEPLGTKLRKGLRRIPGVNVYGPAEGQPRTPTVVFTMDNYSNEFIAKVLGSKAINCWNGDFYAIETMKALNLPDGVVRLGLAPYCTEGDIDRTLATIASIAAGEYDGYEPVID